MWVIYHRVTPVFLGATGSGSITHARGVWFVIYCCPYFGNTANETGILDISFFTFMAVVVWYCLPDSIFLPGKGHAFSSWEFFEYRYVELFRRLRGYNFMWGNDASFFSCGKDVLWFRGISNRVLAFHGKFTSSMARVCCWRGVFIL